jgi:hypothetical protein
MILLIKGYKIRYRKDLKILRSDNTTIEKHNYYIGDKSAIKVDNKWVSCHTLVFKKDNKRTIKIYATQYKNNQSELGEVIVENVDSSLFKALNMNRFWFFLINVYNLLFKIKIWYNKKLDYIKSIKRQFILILIAMLVSCIYFFINRYFDGYLQKLINENNFIQSLIVFLSISSIINIFYPFTLRKETNMDDVKTANKISNTKAQDQERRKQQMEKRYKLS